MSGGQGFLMSGGRRSVLLDETRLADLEQMISRAFWAPREAPES